MNAIDRFLRNKYDIGNWKGLIAYLLENQALIEHATARQADSFRSLEEIRYYLGKAPTENPLEKAWVIYVWICNNEKYIDSFCEICDYCGIKCVEINGYAKGDKYRPYNKIVEYHTWYGIELNKSLHLIDLKWGSKRRSNRTIKEYQPYYFLQPPHIFIYEHYSEDHQLQSKKLNFEKFLRLPRLRYTYFVNGLECTTHDLTTELNLKDKNEFKLEILCNNDTDDLLTLSGTMNDSTDKPVLNSFLIQKNTTKPIYEINISLPPAAATDNGSSNNNNSNMYVFNLFSSVNDEKPQWCAQLGFDMSTVKPNKKFNMLCDAYSIETDVYLMRPINLNLKVNEKHKFELSIYDALEVVLIHDNEIIPLEPVDRNRNNWYLAYKVKTKGEIIISAKITQDGPYISVFSYQVVD